MRIGWLKSRNFELRAWRLFRTRYLRDAQTPDAQQHIDGQLAEKVTQLAPEGQRGGKLRRVVQQATDLWANRSNLRKSDVAYLAAALLYFISPLDAVPDLLPGIGYVDDVLIVSAVVGMIVRGLGVLGVRGKERVEEWLDERTDVVLKRLDETATGGFQRTVAAVAVGLWGTTTAAAVSLSVATAIGSYPVEWLTYVILSAALVVGCNLWTGVYYWRAFRKLDGVWQERLRALVASKLKLRHLFAIGLPVLVLIGLGICRALSAL